MQILDHPPIVADMEDGDDEYDLTEDADDSGGDPSVPGAADIDPTGTSMEYLKEIYKRFQYEFTGKCKGLEVAWLMELLKRSNFVVRREEAKYVCKKLKIRYSEPYYYRDVVVWVPDEQWGVQCTPCCPSCGKNDKIGVHGYRTNHFGRRVVSLNSHYFIMSRRYICHGCKEERGKAEAAIAATAEREGINIEVIPSTKPYTFMGYNPKSVSLLPFGHGDSFPAFFTHRSGVDKKVIDLMRPLCNAGVRPEQLSNILLELHSKEYTRQWKHREHQIEKDLLLKNSSPLKGTMFSTFADRSKYNGAVPTGKYLGNTYKLFHESIRSHLDKEVKKRGATRLHWDVSYKEAKHLCQYKGKPVYKGLVTATNEYGEIRIQVHIVTDSHEQMSPAIAAFRQTIEAYGQPPLKLFSTDNPSGDKAFFQGALPSLLESQARFDTAAAATATTGSDEPINELALSHVLKGNIRVANTLPDINSVITALRTHLASLPVENRVVGLDCEWRVTRNRAGFVVHNDRLATIQIAYEIAGDLTRSIILQVHKLRALPHPLKSLLEDKTIRYAGVNVGGDLNTIGRDLNCIDTIKAIPESNIVNLGKYARRRDVVQLRRTRQASACCETSMRPQIPILTFPLTLAPSATFPM